MNKDRYQNALLNEKTKKFYEQARFDTNNKVEEVLKKELRKMERGPGLLSWFKDRISSIFNLVKVAVLSVFLGRQETARRLESGRNEEVWQKELKELEKDIRCSVYREKLNGSLEIEKQTGQEPQTVLEKETILSQQMKQMTEDYRHSLTNYISDMTGIAKECIDVKSVNGEIRIDFPFANENSQYSQGMTLDKDGNAKEDTAVAKALETLVLCCTGRKYYTSQTHLPGNILSGKECSDIIKHLSEAIEKDGQPHSLKKRGHEITMSQKEDGSMTCQIDGKEIRISQKEGMVKSLEAEFKKTIIGSKKNIEFDLEVTSSGDRVRFIEQIYTEGDFSKLPILSQQLHEITHAEIDQSYYTKYTEKELQNKLTKLLSNFQEGGISREKGIDFHGHHIHIDVNPQREPLRVIVDNEIAYIAPNNMKEHGASNEEIAKSMTIILAASLEQEGLFLNTMNTLEQDSLFVPQLDDKGMLIDDGDSLSVKEEFSIINEALEFEDSYEL